MFKKTFSLLAAGLFMTVCVVQAQNFGSQDFTPLQSTGKVPESFRKQSSEKYKESLKTNISAKDKKLEKNAKKEALLESNFASDEFLLSGKVLFNDPVGLYVTKVLDTLLAHDPKLRKQLEVYVVKSPVVNAFTYSNGIIFINLGLIAQLENEAQLAYVLSHEIIHYTHKHVINRYVEGEKIKKGSGIYRRKSFEDKLLAKSQYSKELETEADLDGLEIYMQSKYSLAAIDGVFDVLKYGHLPFDNVKFDKAFLETKHLKFPDNYFLKRTNPIKDEVENDSLSTHPAVTKRRNIIKEKIENETNKNRKEYFVGKPEFENIRKLARYELSGLYLKTRDYEPAFYNTYLLMKNDTGSKYLKTHILKSLYGLAKYANAERFEEVHLNPEQVQGKQHQVYHLFEKLSSREINTVALNYAWRLVKQYPDDVEIEWLMDELFTELALYHFPVKTFFLNTPKATAEAAEKENDNAVNDDVADAEKDEENKETEASASAQTKKKAVKKIATSKRKIKKKKKNRTREKADDAIPDYYLKYAFVEQMHDSIFLDIYNDKVKEKKIIVKEQRMKKRFSYKEAQRKLAVENKLKGHALGIDKLVVVNPFYLKLDESKKKSPQLLASETAQQKLDKQIVDIASKAGLNVHLLDKKNLSENGAGTLNDLAYLSDWIAEKFEHNDMDFTNFKDEHARNITAAYGTNYFCWMGVVSVKQDAQFYTALPKIVTGLFFPPILPYFVYTGLQPAYETYFYSVILDLNTGKKTYAQVTMYKLSDRNDVLHSHLYDVFQQFNYVRVKDVAQKK